MEVHLNCQNVGEVDPDAIDAAKIGIEEIVLQHVVVCGGQYGPERQRELKEVVVQVDVVAAAYSQHERHRSISLERDNVDAELGPQLVVDCDRYSPCGHVIQSKDIQLCCYVIALKETTLPMPLESPVETLSSSARLLASSTENLSVCVVK